VGTDHPAVLIATIAASIVVARWWWDDRRAAGRAEARPHPLPGATAAPVRAHLIGAAGALVVLAIETAGEHALGVAAAQTKMTVLFAAYTLAAAFLEELIFRGYLVVTSRGRAGLVAGAVAASVAFGLLHPFLWSWGDGGLQLHGTSKAWWSTMMAVLGSLWFYAVRFMPANPARSLLPCVTAHAAKNLGVFVVKLGEGHVTGWW